MANHHYSKRIIGGSSLRRVADVELSPFRITHFLESDGFVGTPSPRDSYTERSPVFSRKGGGVHHGAPSPLHAQLRLIAELDWFTDNENTGVAVTISGLPQEDPRGCRSAAARLTFYVNVRSCAKCRGWSPLRCSRSADPQLPSSGQEEATQLVDFHFPATSLPNIAALGTFPFRFSCRSLAAG